MSHRQIELALLVEVIGQVDFRRRPLARRHAETAAAVVQCRECPRGTMGAQEQVEVPVAVEIDQMQAAQPPLRIGGVVVLENRPQIGFLGDHCEPGATGVQLGRRRRFDRCTDEAIQRQQGDPSKTSHDQAPTSGNPPAGRSRAGDRRDRSTGTRRIAAGRSARGSVRTRPTACGSPA